MVGERRRDACRVLVGPDGEVGAYAWRGLGFWTVTTPRSATGRTIWPWVEVLAAGPAGADAALAASRLWAQEEEALRGGGCAPSAWEQPQTEPSRRRPAPGRGAHPHLVVLGRPPGAYPGRRAPPGRHRAGAVPAGGHPGVTLARDGHDRHRGRRGDHHRRATRRAGDSAGGRRGGGARLELPQTTLIRLVLGAFPPDDLLAREAPQRITEGQGPAGRGALSGDGEAGVPDHPLSAAPAASATSSTANCAGAARPPSDAPASHHSDGVRASRAAPVRVPPSLREGAIHICSAGQETRPLHPRGGGSGVPWSSARARAQTAAPTARPMARPSRSPSSKWMPP